MILIYSVKKKQISHFSIYIKMIFYYDLHTEVFLTRKKEWYVLEKSVFQRATVLLVFLMSPWNAFPESVWFAIVSTCVFCFLHDMFLVQCSPMSFFCIRFTHCVFVYQILFCFWISSFIYCSSSVVFFRINQNLFLLCLLISSKISSKSCFALFAFSKIIALCFLFSLSLSLPFSLFLFLPLSLSSLSLFLLLSSSVSLHNSPCYVVSLFVPLCLSMSLCVSLCLCVSLYISLRLSVSLCLSFRSSCFLLFRCPLSLSIRVSLPLALPFPSSFSLFLFQPLPFSVSLTFGHHDSHTYTYQMFLYFV